MELWLIPNSRFFKKQCKEFFVRNELFSLVSYIFSLFSFGVLKKPITLHRSFAEVRLRVGLREKNLYIGKAFLYALCLTFWNLAVPKRLSKTRQQRRPVDMLLIRLLKPSTCISAWASALLVSTTGRCQSLRRWDEQEEGSHASFIYSNQQSTHPQALGNQGSARTNKKTWKN